MKERGTSKQQTCTVLNLFFHWSPLICTSYCFQGQGHCYVTIPIVFPANQKQSFKQLRDRPQEVQILPIVQQCEERQTAKTESLDAAPARRNTQLTTTTCIKLAVKIYKFQRLRRKRYLTITAVVVTFFSVYNCSTRVLFIVYVPISLILLSPVKCSDREKSDESSQPLLI